MKVRIYLLLLIGALIIASCSIKNEKNVEKLPGIDIAINEMNSKFVLEPDPGMAQVHKNGDPLGFYIVNRSSDAIYFAQDFGIKIFRKQGATWEPVENHWRYPDGENILLTKAESPVGLALIAFPVIEGIKESTDVRIVVTGHVKDKPTEQVGGYIDVLYEP